MRPPVVTVMCSPWLAESNKSSGACPDPLGSKLQAGRTAAGIRNSCTYLTTPFLLAMGGVRVEETELWREGAETWRVLRVYFPASIEAHASFKIFSSVRM